MIYSAIENSETNCDTDIQWNTNQTNCSPQKMFSSVNLNQISESKYLALLKIKEECK